MKFNCYAQLAEDGVRLGCYGHMQDDKLFSTYYVADGKGYRLVPHNKVILVYPKDNGEPRKASFISEFDEDEINKSNVRYLFPAGCKSPEAREKEIQMKSDAVKMEDVTTIINDVTEEITTVVPPSDQNDNEVDSCPTGSCCHESQIQILLPSKSTDPCCSNTYSKLVIPMEAEKLAKIPILEIQMLADENDLVLMLLKLIRLIEKCRQ